MTILKIITLALLIVFPGTIITEPHVGSVIETGIKVASEDNSRDILPVKQITYSNDGLHRRYLAVDQTLHGNLQNLQMVMGQASDNREILRLDQKWELDEGLVLGYPGSVIYNPEKDEYWMYYEVRKPGLGSLTALAISTDGVNWIRKPTGKRGPASLADHDSSNFIHIDSHPAMVNGEWYGVAHAFYDDKDGDFKLAWISRGGIYVTSSSDGIDFGPSQHAFNFKSDTQHSFFYDPIRGEYVMYGRIRGDRPIEAGGWPDGQTDRRGIPIHSSSIWGADWPNVGKVVIDPQNVWEYTTPPFPEGTGPDVYTPGIQVYNGQYVGLPSVFFRDGKRVPLNRPERTTGDGPLYPVFIYSHDGENWVFPDPQSPEYPKHPIIDLTPHERIFPWEHSTNNRTPEVGQIYSASNFIEKDDQLLIYYICRDHYHYEGAANNPYVSPATLNVAFMRRDGFASLNTVKGKTGEWITSVIRIPDSARSLEINAKIKGSLRAEVLDAVTDKPIIGLQLDNFVTFSGDKTSARMSWTSGSIGNIPGKNVKLRLLIEDGAIYSFSFIY